MCTMSVAGIVQTLCAMPVSLATGKKCASEAGDSLRQRLGTVRAFLKTLAMRTQWSRYRVNA